MGTYVTNTGLMATYGGQFTLTPYIIGVDNVSVSGVSGRTRKLKWATSLPGILNPCLCLILSGRIL
ncbi:hypothetical protein EH540_08010 [Escherichia coli]|nr:hypothetical protein [Escherichia coli]